LIDSVKRGGAEKGRGGEVLDIYQWVQCEESGGVVKA